MLNPNNLNSEQASQWFTKYPLKREILTCFLPVLRQSQYILEQVDLRPIKMIFGSYQWAWECFLTGVNVTFIRNNIT